MKIPRESDYKGYTSVPYPINEQIANSPIARMFKKYLLQKAMSEYKWKMPMHWQENFANYMLFTWGYYAIVNTDRYSVIPQPCTLSGYGVQYEPVIAMISNPLLHGLNELVIDKQCVIMRMQPDYSGITDLVNTYGDLMALAIQSMASNLNNSKFSYMVFTTSKAEQLSFERAFDKILNGKGCVTVDNTLRNNDGSINWEMFNQNVGQNFIAPEIMKIWQDLESAFSREIGIPSANTEKKERLISSEVEVRGVETYTRAEMWLDIMKKECKKARELMHIELDVDFRFDPKEQVGGVQNGTENQSVRNA